VFKISKRLDAQKINKIRAKLARVSDPAVKKALKEQLKAAKLVADLRKQLAKASGSAKATLK
jgi:hypothetical protein